MEKKSIIFSVFIFVILLSLFTIASSVTAYKLNYPEVKFSVGKVYAPHYHPLWQLRATKNFKSPKEYDAGFTIILFGSLIIVLASVGIFRKNKQENSYVYGKADWLSNKELRKIHMVNNPDGVVLAQLDTAKLEKITTEKGQSLRIKKEAPLIIDAQNTHTLLIAPTRSGKGVGSIIPTLLHWKGSVFCNDIKGENYRLTSGFRSLFSDVYMFGPTLEDSAKWNPLNEIRIGTSKEISDTQLVAGIIINPDSKIAASDPFWDNQATALLTGVILYLINSKQQEKSLRKIFQILSDVELGTDAKAGMEMLIEKFTDMLNLDTGKPSVNDAKKTYLSQIINASSSEKTFSNIITSTTQKLFLYMDPIVGENTAYSDFSISDLNKGEKPTALYFVIPPDQLIRINSLQKIFIQFLLSKTIEKEDDFDHKLLVLIDEFPALGEMEIFEKTLGYVASYGLKMFLVAQSLNQLYKIYSKDTSIIDNCNTQMYYTPNNANDINALSQRLGKTTTIIENTSQSGQRQEMFDKNISKNKSQVAKDLMNPNEIAEMDYKYAIIFLSGYKPYFAKKNAFYDDSRFKDLVKLAPRHSFYKSSKGIEFDIENNKKENVSESVVSNKNFKAQEELKEKGSKKTTTAPKTEINNVSKNDEGQIDFTEPKEKLAIKSDFRASGANS